MTNDNDLKQAVLAELKWEPSVTAAHIGVTAAAGIVTLTGHVENYAAKSAAETATGRVKGVKAIVEELEVRLPSHIKKGDDEIAAAVIQRLAWSFTVPANVIKVKVEKGFVTLTGQVNWHYQREAVANEVRDLSGVVGIANLVTIKPQVDTQTVSDDITRALHRSWYDPKTITVSAEGGDVTLTGTAHSWHDRNEAEMTAWSAQGITNVKNDIAVVW